jgi:hypothetical protein
MMSTPVSGTLAGRILAGRILAGRRPVRFLNSVALLAAFALASGCAAGDRAVEWSGTREVIDGVEVVRNPGAPLLAAGDVAVEPLWTASGGGELVAATGAPGTTSSDPPEWANPTAITRGGAQLYILDPMESRVYVLGAEDGRWIRAIGRKGGGPGELERPRGIAAIEDMLVIGNGGRATFDLFATDGSYLRSVPIGGISFDFHPLGGGRILATAMSAGRDGSIQGGWRLYRLEGDAGAPEAIESWPTSVAVPGGEVEGGSLECMRTGTAGAHIIRFSCAAPHLQLVDGEGRLLREFVVDRVPELISDAEREAQVERVREEMSRMPGMPPAMIQRMMETTRNESRIRKIFRAVREDPATGILAVWEQNPSDLGSGPATLHLLSRTGIYLAELHFERSWVAFDLSGSTLFTLERDPETDLVSAAAYRIEVPEEFTRAAASGEGE